MERWIYSGPQDIPIPTTFDGVYVEIDHETPALGGHGTGRELFLRGVEIANSAAFQPVRTSTSNESATLNRPTAPWSMAQACSPPARAGQGMSAMSISVRLRTSSRRGARIFGLQFTKNDSSGPFYGWIRARSRGHAGRTASRSGMGGQWSRHGGSRTRAGDAAARGNGPVCAPAQRSPTPAEASA